MIADCLCFCSQSDSFSLILFWILFMVVPFLSHRSPWKTKHLNLLFLHYLICDALYVCAFFIVQLEKGSCLLPYDSIAAAVSYPVSLLERGASLAAQLQHPLICILRGLIIMFAPLFEPEILLGILLL